MRDAMKIEDLQKVRGILADMDGVWCIGDEPIPGAAPALARIRQRDIPLRIISNTTTSTREQLAAKMRRMGMPVEPREIISAPRVAAQWLRNHGTRTARLLVRDEIRGEFEGIAESAHPEVIVIGDIGEAWTYPLMNGLFHQVMEGAGILALHRGRYWQVAEGLKLDIGAFVAGLEYATGVSATVLGKPSSEMFATALQDLALPADDVVMIGDDIHQDVGGAQALGIRGVLVKTGKYRPAIAAGGVAPDLVLDSIATLATAL
jgi:HAD superfamily hydrolase (TIGR01458 family)